MQLLLIFYFTASTVFAKNYCDIKCYSGETHTVCKRNNKCGPDSSCVRFRKAYITADLQQAIVDKHNKLRNRVALGAETLGVGGKQPSAANMQKIKYCKELEYIAQCWANSCKEILQQHHDKCRDTKDMTVGQNVHMSWSTGTIDADEKRIESAIQSWYNEVKNFDPNTVDSFGGSSNVGHYTQMIWATTDQIGCGITNTYNEEKKMSQVALVCNYGPSGNLLGSPIYKRGTPCSSCPDNTWCDDEYPGLCTSQSSRTTLLAYYQTFCTTFLLYIYYN